MEEISILDYINVIWRRRWTVIIAMAAGLVIAVSLLIFLPKTYEAETTLIFPQSSQDGQALQLAQLVGFSMPSGVGFGGKDLYQQVLKSRTLSENACGLLHLNEYGITPKMLRENTTIDTPKDGGLAIICNVPTSWQRGRVPDGELRQRSAEMASRIANTYVSELQIFDAENSLTMSKKNRLFISEQLMRSKRELTDSENRLKNFREAHPMLPPPDKEGPITDQTMQIANQQISAEVALQEVEGQLSSSRATWDKGSPKGISPEAVIDSPVISDLRASLASLEVKRATLLENFTEKHPDVVALDQQITKTREKVNSEAQQVVTGKAGSSTPAIQELLKQIVVAEITREGLNARKNALSGAMSQMEKSLSNLPAQDTEYGRLIRDMKAAEMVYTTLLAEHAKARISEGRDANSFVVLDRAIVPEEPSKPKALLLVATMLIMGLILGMFTAVVQDGFVSMRKSRKL